MTPKSSPQAAANVVVPRVLYRPHPTDEAEIRRAYEEAERGDFLDAETTAAILRWLESGEGPCP